MTPLPDRERILIFDFGSQYGQLIARRVREQNVFCQIVRHDLPAARVAELKPRGLIFSGGPASVYAPGAPRCDPKLFDLGIPVLGICYGMQLACHLLGGEVKPAAQPRVRPGRLPRPRRRRPVRRRAVRNRRLDEPRRSGAHGQRRLHRRWRKPRPVRSPPSAIAAGRSTACSFIPKSATRPSAAESCIISSTISAAARACGKSARSSNRPWRSCANVSAISA